MGKDREGSRKDPDEPDETPVWEVDQEATRARLRREATSGTGPGEAGGGKMAYTDQHGDLRRLPADMGELTGPELGAAARALSQELGAPSPDYARIAAVERLNELHAAGAVSEENYNREKRRLLGGG